MKATGVAQGFKWLADKLHPQLPLTTKESQRLLTALNSSFRRHLDEVHPPHMPEDKSQGRGSGAVPGPATKTLRSSAHSYADKHLATVLTNPLFSQSSKDSTILDYATAKAALARNPRLDPISLLEEYHAKGAASVRIAELCLDTFRNNLASLPKEAQRTRIEEIKPGQRIFHWLLSNGLHNAEAYSDKHHFLDLLAQSLLAEGREDNLWMWIKIEARMLVEERPPSRDAIHLKSRWKSRLLRTMIKIAIGPPSQDGQVSNLNGLHDAIDMFAKACDIKSNATKGTHLASLPLHAAGILIHEQLTWRGSCRSEIDVKRYERFMRSVPLFVTTGIKTDVDVAYAALEICHPTQPSADRALHIIHQLCAEQPDEAVLPFLSRTKDTRHARERQKWFFFLVRTLYLAQENDEQQEADWLRIQIVKEYPELEPIIDTTLRQHSIHKGSDSVAAMPRSAEAYYIHLPVFT